MAKRKDFEAVREIRERLNTANDDALLKLGALAMTHIKNILKKKTGQTSAYHNIAQRHALLEDSMEKMNEGIKFLHESQGPLKRDWQEINTSDANRLRGALFSLLSGCEALDATDIPCRVSRESKNIDKIMSSLEKIKKRDSKSCKDIAKLSLEFERSLRNLDNIIGATDYPGENFDSYSKFSKDLEDLAERTRRLDEALKFSKDAHTKEEWKYFMSIDLERTKDSIKAAHGSSQELIGAATR